MNIFFLFYLNYIHYGCMMSECIRMSIKASSFEDWKPEICMHSFSRSRYFLARVSTYQNKDDIVRGFIIFQRLKKTRPEKEGPTIESVRSLL